MPGCARYDAARVEVGDSDPFIVAAGRHVQATGIHRDAQRFATGMADEASIPDVVYPHDLVLADRHAILAACVRRDAIQATFRVIRAFVFARHGLSAVVVAQLRAGQGRVRSYAQEPPGVPTEGNTRDRSTVIGSRADQLRHFVRIGECDILLEGAEHVRQSVSAAARKQERFARLGWQVESDQSRPVREAQDLGVVRRNVA
eukprot:scaffold817_cov246-Pinguiococcus_pyrenoidosus.AAC.7